MLKIIEGKRFKRDRKKMLGRTQLIEKVREVISLLQNGETLPKKYRDHRLIGNKNGSRDCHIEPNFLLVYYTTDKELHLERVGNHANVLDKKH